MTFENLHVYQAAELLDKKVHDLIERIPRGHSKDIDQLRRATGSLVYNIAEAHGSEQPGRKINFLEISRGSSDEVRAILRRLSRCNAFSVKEQYALSHLTVAISKMLSSWIATIRMR